MPSNCSIRRRFFIRLCHCTAVVKRVISRLNLNAMPQILAACRTATGHIKCMIFSPSCPAAGGGRVYVTSVDGNIIVERDFISLNEMEFRSTRLHQRARRPPAAGLIFGIILYVSAAAMRISLWFPPTVDAELSTNLNYKHRCLRKS